MNVLDLNKFKIQSAFVKSLFIVDNEDQAMSELHINEKLFFEKLQGFMPCFNELEVPTHLEKSDSLTLYHRSHKDPSCPDISAKLFWFEEVKDGETKYFIKLQF